MHNMDHFYFLLNQKEIVNSVAVKKKKLTQLFNHVGLLFTRKYLHIVLGWFHLIS